MSDAEQPKRPTIPPITGVRPLTDAEVARLKQIAERGQRAQEAAQKLPHDDEQPVERPVIYPDADEYNANWLRLLAKRRQQQDQDKEHQSNG